MRKRIEVLPGDKFHLLTAIRPHKNKLNGRPAYVWRCECGQTKPIQTKLVALGNTKSCGCLHTKHKMSGTPEWSSWRSMRKRCLDKNYHAYERYGGRGIKICDRWNDFKNFLSDMGPRPKGTTLDRTDPNKGYNKENCRWVDWKTQGSSRRNVRFLTCRGKTMHIHDWCKETGYSSSKIKNRLRRGLSVEDAIFGTAHPNPGWQKNRKTTVWLEARGERKPLKYWAKDVGISATTITRRLRSGLSVEEAIFKPLTRDTKKGER